MKRIAGVALEGEKFSIDRSTGTELERLFGIDSMILVLGKNGAGKTTLLHGIAESVSLARNTRLQNVFVGDYDSIAPATPSYLRSCGVVYFSPLPYRKSLPKRTRLLDASPDFRGAQSLGQIEQFHKVASDLDIDTSLEATIGYPQRFYREVVIPVLLARKVKILDLTFEKMVVNLRDTPRPGDIASESRIDFNERENESQINRMTSELVRFIKNHADGYFETDKERILYLACMQALAKNKSISNGLGRLFLTHMGLATFDGMGTDLRTAHEFQQLIERTRVALGSNDWQLSKIDPNVLTLSVKSESHALSLHPETTAVQISWTKLSSGLRALVEQFTSLRQAFLKFSKSKCRNILLLIDEGDAYLHLDWQRKYIYMLDKFLSAVKLEFEFEQLQVVLATHSPLIAADFPSALVDNLDGKGSSAECFAAPIEDVIVSSFGAGSLGLFAEKKINEILAKARHSKLSASDLKLIDSIGDEGLRTAINRSIGRNKNDN